MPASINAVPRQRCKSQRPGSKIQTEKCHNGDDLHGGKNIKAATFHRLPLLLDQSMISPIEQRLFNQSLPRGVDEVGISRVLPGGAYKAGDLPAMISRVQHNVGQNILHGVLVHGSPLLFW